jgi:hypothetical protein
MTNYLDNFFAEVYQIKLSQSATVIRLFSILFIFSLFLKVTGAKLHLKKYSKLEMLKDVLDEMAKSGAIRSCALLVYTVYVRFTVCSKTRETAPPDVRPAKAPSELFTCFHAEYAECSVSSNFICKNDIFACL